ncbi:hypothetical protein [Rhizobium sp. AAP43]|uniref:hypothetical protein n=1 Tax=Rhizobium sp. AAP43 TaxID=1523420 RepID=UPI0006B8A09F|nr:hypothetical protein [Rhizobium sp. AAP43]KPF41509.1 hypothetical protein IP76_21230 [Rhizobium sp. AAP43]
MRHAKSNKQHSEPEAREAAAVLSDVFMDLARSEALTRALTDERNGKPERADYWVGVFLAIPTLARD